VVRRRNFCREDGSVESRVVARSRMSRIKSVNDRRCSSGLHLEVKNKGDEQQHAEF